MCCRAREVRFTWRVPPAVNHACESNISNYTAPFKCRLLAPVDPKPVEARKFGLGKEPTCRTDRICFSKSFGTVSSPTLRATRIQRPVPERDLASREYSSPYRGSSGPGRAVTKTAFRAGAVTDPGRRPGQARAAEKGREAGGAGWRARLPARRKHLGAESGRSYPVAELARRRPPPGRPPAAGGDTEGAGLSLPGLRLSALGFAV